MTIPNKRLAGILIIVAFLLPFIAMQVTDEVNRLSLGCAISFAPKKPARGGM